MVYKCNLRKTFDFEENFFEGLGANSSSADYFLNVMNITTRLVRDKSVPPRRSLKILKFSERYQLNWKFAYFFEVVEVQIGCTTPQQVDCSLRTNS